MENVRSEIFKHFIPQQEFFSKNRSYFRWERGREYVEVQIPGFKIGKLGSHETRPWVVASFAYPYRTKAGSTVYKQITSSHLYEKTQLESLLKELNR